MTCGAGKQGEEFLPGHQLFQHPTFLKAWQVKYGSMNVGFPGKQLLKNMYNSISLSATPIPTLQFELAGRKFLLSCSCSQFLPPQIWTRVLGSWELCLGVVQWLMEVHHGRSLAACLLWAPHFLGGEE